jgi:putative ATP-dependent endonuclease of the OLD family
MYLSKIQIANFRKIQSLDLELNKGLNLLVGENDSGKSAIIDAIKFVLGTHSNDWLRLEKDDFYSADGKSHTTEIKIICIFKDLSEDEAAMFLEWLSIESSGYFLKLTFKAKRKENSNSISEISYDIKAGEDEESGVMSGEARNKLRVTYLKPLRDAEYELAPRKGSRLSQILANYDIFQTEQGEKHTLVKIMNTANTSVNDYFETFDGKEILEKINDEYLKDFSLTNNGVKSKLDISPNELGRILEKLELRGVSDNGVGNLGIGSNNLLFIAAEMLLLKGSNYTGLKLSLIEEIEAHLHPQSQINLIDFLSKQSVNLGVQSIVTTHSNSLASKVDLNNIIICKNGKAFSLRKSETKLNAGDYEFLRRFLDDTKANLFFANGVIMVEGDAENLFLPTFAEFIGFPLHKYGVSIVNVRSIALLRYARIFLRADETKGILEIPVAVVTDLDIKPKIYFENYPDETKIYKLSQTEVQNVSSQFGELTGINFSPLFGIEYSSKAKLESDFKSLIPKELKVKTKAGDSLSELLVPTDFNLHSLPNIRLNALQKRQFEDQKVKYFVGTDWTLEYLLGLSCLKNLFYEAILTAKLLQKSDEFDLDEKEYVDAVDEIKHQVQIDFSTWEVNMNPEEIAYKLYWETMQGKGTNKTSKAIVAQCLASLLIREKDNSSLISQVKKDQHLKYLIDSINHVTNDQP